MTNLPEDVVGPGDTINPFSRDELQPDDIVTADVINQMVRECHRISREHGFWEHDEIPAQGFWGKLFRRKAKNPSIVPEKLMLCVTELSEAMESERDGDTNTAEEMIDCWIRICDIAGYRGYNLGNICAQKMAKNRSRPYKHGRLK